MSRPRRRKRFAFLSGNYVPGMVTVDDEACVDALFDPRHDLLDGPASPQVSEALDRCAVSVLHMADASQQDVRHWRSSHGCDTPKEMSPPLFGSQDHLVTRILCLAGPAHGAPSIPSSASALFLWQLIRRTPAGWKLTSAGRTALALTMPPEDASGGSERTHRKGQDPAAVTSLVHCVAAAGCWRN
jgi:hypothetical protein